MKCTNCNNNIKFNMHYCPYCSRDLTYQILNIKKQEKVKKIIIYIITLLIVIGLYGRYRFETISEKRQQMDNMVTSICDGKFETIYINDTFKDQGIYQCKNNSYVYFVHNSEADGYGKIYEFGYTYHKDVEDYFPNAIYFYRESFVSGVASELKIAVVANSEDELINNYAEQFYEFIKNLNKEYKQEIQLTIYYNDSLSGINTTYDKLFLMAQYNTNNVTQAFGLGRGYGEYTLYDGDPYDLLEEILINNDSYPDNARKAIKNNRNIILMIEDGQTIEFDEFVEKFKESFNDAL